MADSPTAATGAYWNNPAVAEHFRTLPPPPYLRELIAANPPARPRAVGLDAGCGAGRNLACLVGAGYRTVGFDLHAGMLQSARRSCAKALVHQASVLAIPLRDECCEIVVCHGVVHNLAPFRQIERALRELARVTSPSGKISLNLFSDSHIDPCLTPTGQPGVFALPNAQRMTLLSPETIQNLAEAAGLALDGPATTYLSPGDPGQRSVWRAVLTRVRSIRAQKAAAACFL